MERLVTRPIEKAVRSRVSTRIVLPTPTGDDRFTVDGIANKGPVRPLGEKESRMLIPRAALEGAPGLVSARACSTIVGVHSQFADPTTLDGYMKRFVNRATAGSVASLLGRARLVQLNRDFPTWL